MALHYVTVSLVQMGKPLAPQFVVAFPNGETQTAYTRNYVKQLVRQYLTVHRDRYNRHLRLAIRWDGSCGTYDHP